jgi:hypothetical protein
MSSKENSPERPSDNSQQNGESEKGKDGDEKPKPVGLFSPELKHVRREIAWKWCLTTLTLMAAIMAVLSLCEFLVSILGRYSELTSNRLGSIIPCGAESIFVGRLRRGL